MSVRQCILCEEWKAINDDFYPQMRRCKECHKKAVTARTKERYSTDPAFRKRVISAVLERYHTDPVYRAKNIARATVNRRKERAAKKARGGLRPTP